jgi:hypothetical protein
MASPNVSAVTGAREAASSGITLLARLGYAAKGVVYLLIGGLAALAALGQGGATTDNKGAIEALYRQPLGGFLLGVVAFGLFAYALWSFLQAALDTEQKGGETKGILSRIGFAGVGLSYALLALAALQLLLGAADAGQSSDAAARDGTARLLEQPFGPALVVIAGLVLSGLALAQFYQAYTANFGERANLEQLSARTREGLTRLARFGMAARGVVFGIIGFFLVVAALRQSAGEAKGMGGALQELARQPFGQLLLGVVALGLVAYGVYSLAQARYRRLTRV